MAKPATATTGHGLRTATAKPPTAIIAPTRNIVRAPCRSLREWLHDALTALLESRTPDLAQITARWANAAPRAALRMTSGGARIQAAPLIPDRLAFAAIDLLTGLDLTRLRACPPDDGGCGWLFLDHSRNNSRRWCVMADCGTQAKSRKLTARRRSERIAARGSAPS